MESNMFDDQLLSTFISKFYGYGNYHGKYWFVGMEEGGGDNKGQIDTRLKKWQKRGEKELEDLKEYHLALGIERHFSEKPALQRTWSKLIRILLRAENEEITSEKEIPTEEVRIYQRDLLGRTNGETCLLELLPLPSPSIKLWLYGDFSKLPHLEKRESYRDHYAQERVPYIQQRISAHKPKAVVFYGLNYQEYWRKIAQVEFIEFKSEKDSEGIISGKNKDTRFIITSHPATKGIKNEYFYRIGEFIRRNPL